MPKIVGMTLASGSEWFGWLMGKEPTFTKFKVTFSCATRWHNIEKARRILGYEPEVGVQEGVKRMVEVSSTATLLTLLLLIFFHVSGGIRNTLLVTTRLLTEQRRDRLRWVELLYLLISLLLSYIFPWTWTRYLVLSAKTLHSTHGDSKNVHKYFSDAFVLVHSLLPVLLLVPSVHQCKHQVNDNPTPVPRISGLSRCGRCFRARRLRRRVGPELCHAKAQPMTIITPIDLLRAPSPMTRATTTTMTTQTTTNQVQDDISRSLN